MFFIIIGSIIKHKKLISNRTNSKAGFAAYKESLIIALSLTIIFGLGWAFGLLATSYPSEAVTITFQVVFSIFVGSQGILLFVLHGIRNPDARGLWKRWWTSFGTTTRLTYIMTTSNKGITSINASHASGSATLPHTLPRNVDSCVKPTLNIKHQDIVKVDLSTESVLYHEGASKEKNNDAKNE